MQNGRVTVKTFKLRLRWSMISLRCVNWGQMNLRSVKKRMSALIDVRLVLI